MIVVRNFANYFASIFICDTGIYSGVKLTCPGTPVTTGLVSLHSLKLDLLRQSLRGTRKARQQEQRHLPQQLGNRKRNTASCHIPARSIPLSVQMPVNVSNITELQIIEID
jgi:hypothetical protein